MYQQMASSFTQLPKPEVYKSCLTPPSLSPATFSQSPSSVNSNSRVFLGPLISHMSYRSHFLSEMYVSSFADSFFKHKFEISIPCLTPFSDLDSGQMPVNDLQRSPQSGCSSPHVIMWKQYSRVLECRPLNQTTKVHILVLIFNAFFTWEGEVIQLLYDCIFLSIRVVLGIPCKHLKWYTVHSKCLKNDGYRYYYQYYYFCSVSGFQHNY